MHEALTTYAHTLQQYSLKLQEHGLQIEHLGRKLQEYNDQLAMEHGQAIEEYGRVIQHRAREALVYIAQEQDDYPSGFMRQAIQKQTEARAVFIQALIIYVQMMQKRLKQIGEHL